MKIKVMKIKVINFLFLLSLFTIFTLNISAQYNAKLLPFKSGEILTYEGKLSKIIQGIAVADLSFNFTNAPDSDDYLVKSEARSKGSLIKLFRYSFYQKYESYIDNENFYILKTVRHDEQKDRVRDSIAIFDYTENQVTFTEVNPKEPMRAPRKIASEIKGETHDIVSGIYALRTYPLAVGKVFELNISDSGLIYKIPVRVAARERQKSIFGKVMCFRIEPEVFGATRLIDEKGTMTIWMTDDTRRIPVRARIDTELGKLEVKLKTIETSK
jgi:hypothetical protein